MIIPELKSVISLELDRPSLPWNPADCAITIEARIGPAGSNVSDVFSLTAMTPSRFLRDKSPRWGRGILVVKEFSWECVDQMLKQLLARAQRDSWEEVAAELNKELLWEFDNCPQRAALAEATAPA